MSSAVRRYAEKVADPLTFISSSSKAVPRQQHWLPFQLIKSLTLGCDFVIILLASIVSGGGYHWLALDSFGDINTFLAIGGLVFANFFALTSAQQNYHPTNLINVARQFRYVTINWLFIFFMLTALAFALKSSDSFSRGAALSFLVLGWMSVLGFRLALSRRLMRSLADGSFAQKKVVLISERGQQSASQALAQLRQCGYLPVKTFELTSAEIDAAGVSRSLSQKIENILSTSQREAADYVFLLLKWDRPQLINSIVCMLRALPIPVHLIPDENVSTFLAARAETLGRTFTVELQRAPLTAVERAVKRAFDVIVATTGMIVLAPFMLMTALMIKLDSTGPILFKQKRNGFNGSVFPIYKFRTMRVLEDGENIRQATRYDPRVTRMGRWLRSTSIDELPQLVERSAWRYVPRRPEAPRRGSQQRISSSGFELRVPPSR